ncbi:acyltransferase family protein [Massilia violaceinigra]|uniref:Acyltransferase family protein n=1 Tax=Massilia violaceinigra TaxID=2045208 RepID=A0ABY4A6A4_9BURK|nr:acyltransferase family protein [Massilia violaceinigra]UOD30310.1 acyltransferase family protein [Massilia violaceinigra]
MTTSPARLWFLDWVRILAFFVLIVYHVGMYYVTWDWHVKSAFASHAIEPLMLLSSPWRLGLLFMVSGVASSLMLAKTGAARFLGQRSARLLVPLVFGMLVIVPPQAYLEVVEKLAYQGSYADFMRLYLGRYHGFCRGADCLVMPTWNHLWFVAYLWVYTLLLGGLVAGLGSRFDRLATRLANLLVGWKIIVLPVALLSLARMTMLSRFPTTHALVDDWFNHAVYLFLFLLGAMLARTPPFWPRLEQLRWHALGLAAAGWAALTIYYALPDDVLSAQAQQPMMHLQRIVYCLFAWNAMLAAIGFAHRHLNRDSANRRYLAQAVFPVYIVHQTLIVVIAHAIQPAKLAPGLEALVLVVLTLCLSFAVADIVRRSRLLRPLFGIAPLAADARNGRASQQVTA